MVLHNANSPKGGTATVIKIADRTEGISPQRDFSVSNDRPIPTRELVPEGFLASEIWHKPYAEALMETEPARLPGLIGAAEHAIFGRYLELCANPGGIEHSRDLQNAVNVLTQLKNAVGNPVDRSHSVSKTVLSHP